MLRTVSKEIEFDAGHRVPNHKSKCRNPHGHRYRLRVTIAGDIVTTPGASDEGMLADFGDLKEVMTHYVHDTLDHGFIVYKEDQTMLTMFQDDGTYGGEERCRFKYIITSFIPTAENLAEWCWYQMKPLVENMGFRMHLVELWETPTSLATFSEN